jgi:hypothetical protein
MDRQSFQSNLILARPDGKVQVYQGGYTPFWQSLTKPRPTLTLSQTMTLQTPVYTVGITPLPQVTSIPSVDAGVWISSWSNSNVRSVA